MGIPAGKGQALPSFAWTEPEDGDPRRTALHAVHQEMGAKMVPFAGWDMPVWYTSVLEEHLATRQAAGLFDVCHMGVYQVEGDGACAFLDSVVTNDVSSLRVGWVSETKSCNTWPLTWSTVGVLQRRTWARTRRCFLVASTSSVRSVPNWSRPVSSRWSTLTRQTWDMS